jgi:hypothetical protein
MGDAPKEAEANQQSSLSAQLDETTVFINHTLPLRTKNGC